MSTSTQETSKKIRNKTRTKQVPRKQNNKSEVIDTTKKNNNNTTTNNNNNNETIKKRNNKDSVVWQVCSVPNRKTDRNAVQPAVCQCGFKYDNYIPNNGLTFLKKHVENNCPVYKAILEEKKKP